VVVDGNVDEAVDFWDVVVDGNVDGAVFIGDGAAVKNYISVHFREFAQFFPNFVTKLQLRSLRLHIEEHVDYWKLLKYRNVISGKPKNIDLQIISFSGFV